MEITICNKLSFFYELVSKYLLHLLSHHSGRSKNRTIEWREKVHTRFNSDPINSKEYFPFRKISESKKGKRSRRKKDWNCRWGIKHVFRGGRNRFDSWYKVKIRQQLDQSVQTDAIYRLDDKKKKKKKKKIFAGIGSLACQNGRPTSEENLNLRFSTIYEKKVGFPNQWYCSGIYTSPKRRCTTKQSKNELINNIKYPKQGLKS